MKYLGGEVRTPLSKKEYWAYKQLTGMLNIMLTEESNLGKRAKLVKNGWRDLRMVTSVSRKLMKDIWSTIPGEQQKRIRKELQHTVTYVDVKRPQDNVDDKAMTYMPMAALCRIADRVMRQECLFCDKCGKKVHTCQLRKDLEATDQWHIDRLPDGSCPFSGLIATSSKKK